MSTDEHSLPTRSAQRVLDFSSTDSRDDNLVAVRGSVERIVYENAETGFLVGRLKEEDSSQEITFVGSFLAVSPGDCMRLWGRWSENPRYGREFRVERFEVLIPSTVEGIEKYLGSGLIEGIGKEFARRIVTVFGAETLRIIDEEPERLRSVPGIGEKRAAQIRQAWEVQKNIRAIMVFLQGHGIGVNHAVRIYKRYGDKALTVLRENPYRLAEDISGIAFRTADAIAQSLGIPKDSPLRAQAGMRYALEQASSEGHVFLPREELRERVIQLLEATPALFEEALISALERKTLISDEKGIYLPHLYYSETGVARLLKTIASSPLQEVSILVEKAIPWLERRYSLQLSEEQRQAIRTAVAAKTLVITGGPGTGKTTIIRSLLDIFEQKGLSIALAAPTGRAAKRITAATGREAKTIHRLLEFSPQTGKFTRNDTNPLRIDMLVVDECSMVDVLLMYSLLKAVPPCARLVLVGDVDQLPSVGPGTVLFDIITSNVIPVVWLKTVFRQAAESGIITNAHRINQGAYPEFNTRDFFFVDRQEPEGVCTTIVDLVAHRIPKRFGLDPKRDIQVLAPMHRGPAGVIALNEALQRVLNPHGSAIPGRRFGVGDKVMQQRNNYELDVFNGDVGIICGYDEDDQSVSVQYDDRTVVYPRLALDELELAYAGTVHKAQGSEYPAVVIPVVPQHHIMLQRNVLYTAVTRASRLVVMVGTPKALHTALRNTKVVRRYSGLADRLRQN
ncbi:MAG TPA: ATP-dependent RecD-like DNA helicase [Candidatus Hydrogenedentes bacterium]|nr:ATP-dependent RecD-like DNA helicase [Candidatus Hydrogenedentota bacterium]HOL76294.1 ATP-dependent RecD-like DNA helicase [Candidatus Hydrogenedentota bacterium]HPO86121.1 ATP-dependent RecD-like DNA helicase [Candidatus Hydrogenedentota bacterium]